MKDAQLLLYSWLEDIGEVNYNKIKDVCIYLAIKFNLQVEKPINYLFYPLFYNGVVDFTGNGNFCITPECIITNNKKVNIIINSKINDESFLELDTGICLCMNDIKSLCSSSYKFNIESILSNIPSIESYISSLPIDNSSIREFEKNSGVTIKKNDSNLKKYLIDNNLNIIYNIPHQSINPDAINISICYERVLNSESNGYYYNDSKELRMKIYHLPIIVYRILMIMTLFEGNMPTKENGYYVFKNISKRSYFELNRIFCKSIKNI